MDFRLDFSELDSRYFFEAGRPTRVQFFLLIFEIEISQVITNFHHHHIKT